MKISDGTLEVSIEESGNAGEFQVRVPKALGDEMRQDLEEAGFHPSPKGEFSADPGTAVFLIAVGSASVATLLRGLAPVLKEFWHRHDGKQVTFTSHIATTGAAESRTYTGFGQDAVVEMEHLLNQEVEENTEARRRLEMQD
jgi:hypothetical protein